MLLLAWLELVALGGPNHYLGPLEVQRHEFRVDRPGHYKVAVQHYDVDVAITLRSKSGDILAAADIADSNWGEEYVVLSASGAGEYHLEVANVSEQGARAYRFGVERAESSLLPAMQLSARATTPDSEESDVMSQHQAAIAAWAEHGNLDEQARLYHSLGSRQRMAGQPGPSESSYQRAAELWLQGGETQKAMWSRYWAGAMLVWKGEVDTARALFAEVAGRAELIHDNELIGASRNYVALTYLIQGELLQAREHYLGLTDFLEANDLLHQLATVYHNIGSTYYESGEPDPALEYFELAIATARQVDPDADVSSTLEEIGGLYALMGRCDRSFEYLQRVLSIPLAILV